MLCSFMVWSLFLIHNDSFDVAWQVGVAGPLTVRNLLAMGSPGGLEYVHIG